MRLRLDEVPIPDGAEVRAHGVAMTSFAERRPAPRRRNHWRPAVVIVAVAAVAGVLASPPGRSVIQSLREAVGVKKTQHELFSLPTVGRILVDSSGGPWIVGAHGSRRHLGSYREASWSPYGRFIVAARANELVTLDSKGSVRWTLARPAVRFPRWSGTHTDTRIAFLSHAGLHVVAGDGTGDQVKCADGVAPVAPAWQPHSLRLLAFAAPNGQVVVYDVTDCRLILRTPQGPAPAKLQWSSDGRLLLALSPFSLRVYDLHGHVVARDDPSAGTIDADATFVTGTHQVVVVRVHGSQADVFQLASGRTLFQLVGGLRQAIASPDGRWLLLTAPAADQWIFMRLQGSHAIRAFSGITRQFGGGVFPAVSGWIGK